jgi:hypothetical protein
VSKDKDLEFVTEALEIAFQKNRRLGKEILQIKGLMTSRGIFEFALAQIHLELSPLKVCSEEFNASEVCCVLDGFVASNVSFNKRKCLLQFVRQFSMIYQCYLTLCVNASQVS